MPKKQTTASIRNKKKSGNKITALTAYDYPSARIVDRCGMDLVLVGDSLGMAFQGCKNTLAVTLDEVIYHAAMVCRAVESALVVVDMPYGTFHESPEATVRNCIRVIKETGCDAVKIEGGRRRLNMVQAILEAEIPVMGHIGLTPQSINRLGGYKIQGQTMDEIESLIADAGALQAAGCFAIVLEGIPHPLSRLLTRRLEIPTIGIGAGPDCDGQILVFHDLLGLNPGVNFKHVRTYANLADIISEAISRYMNDVRQGQFPSLAESFALDTSTSRELEGKYGNNLQDQQAQGGDPEDAQRGK